MPSNPAPRACVEAVRTGLKADALGCLCWVNPDIPLPCDACCALVATAVLAAFVEGEVEGPYNVVSPFPDGPLTRVRHESLFGHEWGFAYPHMARAVANALNYLEAR